MPETRIFVVFGGACENDFFGLRKLGSEQQYGRMLIEMDIPMRPWHEVWKLVVGKYRMNRRGSVPCLLVAKPFQVGWRELQSELAPDDMIHGGSHLVLIRRPKQTLLNRHDVSFDSNGGSYGSNRIRILLNKEVKQSVTEISLPVGHVNITGPMMLPKLKLSHGIPKTMLRGATREEIDQGVAMVDKKGQYWVHKGPNQHQFKVPNKDHVSTQDHDASRASDEEHEDYY